MPRLSDVVRRHGPGYLERHRAAIVPSHARAVRAIVRCRTPALGGHLAACTKCDGEHLFFHSCRHRACAQCGHDATAAWLRGQRARLLPVPYFQVVFTLPGELRRPVRSHQRALLPALFKAAFAALASLCADPRWLGASTIGALAVLHTWTRTLEWHPHVHLLVPAVGLAADGRTIVRPPRRRWRFLVPEAALAKKFRGRFLALARRALPRIRLPTIPWRKRWVVHAKPCVQGADKVLDYLCRYVHRTAVSDSAIVALDDTTVTFRYRSNQDGARRTMRLPADEFLRRFLQHVPPPGFHRVRAYGLLHPRRREALRQLQLSLAPTTPPPPATPSPRAARPPLSCPRCGSPMRLVRHLPAIECLALVTAILPTARAPPPCERFRSTSVLAPAGARLAIACPAPSARKRYYVGPLWRFKSRRLSPSSLSR